MYQAKEEIFQQVESLRRAQARVTDQQAAISSFFSEKSYKEVVFVACGSSYWLSLSAHMTFMEKTSVKTFAVKAGDVVLNESYYSKIYQTPLLVVPSRSGTTTEVLEAIRIFKKAYGEKTPVFSIIIYEDSPLQAVSDYTLLLPWANEKSVCQTRSFSTLYLAACLVAAIVGKASGLTASFQSYLEEADILLQSLESQLQPLVGGFSELVVLGSGAQYGIAVEGAYISIEMAALPAFYYGTMELRHGPIVRVTPDTLVICVFSRHHERYYEDVLKMVKDKGAGSVVISGEPQESLADYVFSPGPSYEPEVIALYAIAVMQGLAYLKALQLGINPDQPQGLVPFIEIETGRS